MHMQRIGLIGLLILSSLAVIAGLYMNRFGVNVEPDSAVCMSAGILFAHGEGISEPNLLGPAKAMTWFPPTIPFIVAIFEKLDFDILKAFAVLNALSWGLLTGWVGWLAYRIAGRTPLLGIFAATAILTSNAICYVHGMLYSEPLFLLWTTGSLATLACYWDRPHLRWSVAAALCVGGALLTRYVGLTLVVTGSLILLLRPSQNWRRRLGVLVVFTALSFGPLFAWHVWQKNVRHASSERTLEWHPITSAQIDEGITTLSAFIIPPEFSNFPYSKTIILTLAIILVLAALWLGLSHDNQRGIREKLAEIPSLVWISALFIAIYGSFLIVSISIADADTPLDDRILSIILPPTIIITAYLAFTAGWKRMPRLSNYVAIGCVCGLLTFHGISTIRNQVTRDYLTWSPRDPSILLDTIRSIPDQALIFSNEPAAVYMATRRKSEGLPYPLAKEESDSAKQDSLNQKMAFLKKTMGSNGGWVVYWIRLHGDPVVSEDFIKKTMPVQETLRFDDGIILHIAPQG